mgnify:CR=1 FL=1
MSVNSFDELMEHLGHHIECVHYANKSATIECMDCNQVLFEYPQEREPVNLYELLTIAEDGIYIYNNQGEEIVSWIQDEWVEDPSVVLSIASAIRILVEDGPLELESFLED